MSTGMYQTITVPETSWRHERVYPLQVDEQAMLAYLCTADGIAIVEREKAKREHLHAKWQDERTLSQVIWSLDRFDLVSQEWDAERGFVWRVMDWVPSAVLPWRQSLAIHADIDGPCCEAGIKVPCVCRYKSACAVHGGGCHGSHD